MRSVTITKLPNGAKGITEFEKLTVSPKPRAVSSSLTAPARQIPVKTGICQLNPS